MSLEERSDETEKEEDEWQERYWTMLAEEVKRKAWSEDDSETLLGDGHEVLNVARMIMLPQTQGSDDENSGPES
ncbi:hypothetical protein BST61_g11606 [Cercospora zeina]